MKIDPETEISKIIDVTEKTFDKFQKSIDKHLFSKV